MKFLILLPLLFFINSLHSQEAWILNISTPLTEKIYDIREAPNGNYIACGRRDENEGTLVYGFIVEISKEGALIKEHDEIIDDSSTFFSHIISISDTSFVILGKIGPHYDTNELWIVHYDYNFNIIKQKRIPCFTGFYFVEYLPKFISNRNLLIYGFVDNGLWYSKELFFYETNLDGDSISSALIEIPSDQMSLDFIERRNEEGYYAYTMGAFPEPPPPGVDAILSFDTNFVLQSVDSVPGGLYHPLNANWLSESSYLLTGKEGYHNPSYVNMGILKLDTLDQILNENYFGLMADTNTYPGSGENIDFRNPDSIFYSGTGNFHIGYPWQTEPSWIIVNCLDSNLNLRWQTLYGGDAFYHSWEVYATSDGGCLVSASKFDYTTGILDNDAVLLKYDRNGLLTGVNEDEELPKSLVIYPNPGNDVIKIENNFKDGLFQIFDQSGRCVLKSSLESGLNMINVNGMNAGIYIYMISIDNKQVATGKWIKQ